MKVHRPLASPGYATQHLSSAWITKYIFLTLYKLPSLKSMLEVQYEHFIHKELY